MNYTAICESPSKEEGVVGGTVGGATGSTQSAVDCATGSTQNTVDGATGSTQNTVGGATGSTQNADGASRDEGVHRLRKRLPTTVDKSEKCKKFIKYQAHKTYKNSLADYVYMQQSSKPSLNPITKGKTELAYFNSKVCCI